MVALARLGAIQNPLIPILREREVGFITNQVGTEVFITTEQWRGFEHGELARTLAAEQGFDVILTDLDTDPSAIGNTLRLAQAIRRRSRRPRPTGRSCGGSTRRRARPPTPRASATPTGR